MAVMVQKLKNPSILIYTSALRLLALRGLRTLRVRRFTQGSLGILEKQYVAFLFYTKYAGLSFVYGYINEIRTVAEILFRD